jgi:hypothetical protein
MTRSKQSVGWILAMVTIGMLAAASCGETCPDPRCHEVYGVPIKDTTPPVPGPPIKIIVGGGNAMEFRSGTTTITSSNAGYVIAPAFLLKISRLELIKTSSPVDQWPLKSTAVGKVTMDDGKSFTFKKSGLKLAYTCIDADGTTTHPITAGSDSDGIPACMLGVADSHMIVVTDGPSSVEADFFLAETEL